jgi:phosphatidylserine synthase
MATQAPREAGPADELPGQPDDYLAAARRFKLRRLWALIVLCAMLLAPLLTIYAEGWWKLTGGSSSVGTGWVLVGIGVVIAAVAAVVIDMLYRKEL